MSITAVSEQHQIAREESWWLKAALLLMFLLATLIRLDEIRAPGHLLDREYTSAIFARAYYFSHNDDVADWRREIAVTAKNQQPILEPPVLEYLVSWIYRLTGVEDITYARYLTNAFWLIGGVFLFLLARKLMSAEEALVATGYYLFVPMGIIISRSFQPDSLMMMMFLISLYCMVLYFDAPSTRRLLTTGILTGITLLLRPLVLFAIFLAYLGFSIHRNKSWKKIVDGPLVIFGVVSVLPSALYYGYGILFAGFMRWKISSSFMPFLLTKIDFWQGWFDIVMDVAEFTPLLLAVIGFFLLRNTKVRYLVIALAIAFITFSVAFTYHIHTHPYYHIQLFPIVALCLAPVAVSLVGSLMHAVGRFWWIPVMGVVLLGLYVSFREVRGNLYQTRMEDPALAWEIGERIEHSPNTVYVAFYYGVPLEYHGEFGGAPWPVSIEDAFYRRPAERELSVQERLDGFNFTPEYFVITHFDLYNRKHQDLKAYLERDCTLLADEERYLIYTSCRPSTGG